VCLSLPLIGPDTDTPVETKLTKEKAFVDEYVLIKPYAGDLFLHQFFIGITLAQSVIWLSNEEEDAGLDFLAVLLHVWTVRCCAHHPVHPISARLTPYFDRNGASLRVCHGRED